MASIPRATVWIGSDDAYGIADETPRFQAEVGAFCMDFTEVTVDAYRGCIAAGACKPSLGDRVTCTVQRKRGGPFPINCVDWHQATAFCEWRGARLPSEVEWEYAASGGDGRRYAWGDEPPDGRTCWKERAPCKVGSFRAGAFGLFDMTGNVWEWTADWYGGYPWSPADGIERVYRGGSWSRRFEKWMRVPLRNRWQPRRWGSHLGFRCASTPAAAPCSGQRLGSAGPCPMGLRSVACAPPTTWNGARCARPGAPLCPAGRHLEAGHGCVLDAAAPRLHHALNLAAVVATRTPEFDGDCRTHKLGRPSAWRFDGGSHEARNAVGESRQCANRDVGAGWNSACCP